MIEKDVLGQKQGSVAVQNFVSVMIGELKNTW